VLPANKPQNLNRQLSRTFILALVNVIFSCLLAIGSIYFVSKGFRKEERFEFCTIFLIPGLIYFSFMLFGLSTIFSKKKYILPYSKSIDFFNLLGIIIEIFTVFYFISV
jgi:hypothetical protein